MATKVKTGVIDSGAITSALITDASITADDLHTTLDLTGKTVTVATASASDNDTSVASTAYVTTAIANLADSAPSTLNTLNELAAALGDDANFSTTVTNSIATKLPLAGGTMTGNIAHASDFTIDAGGDIILDADGADVILKDGGTSFLEFDKDGSNARLKNPIADGDIKIQGVDGASTITALSLDMSEAGAATFNSTLNSGAITSSGAVTTPSTDVQQVRILQGTATAGGIFKERTITGAGVSNDVSIFAESITDGGEIHFMTGGSATKRVTIDATGNVGIGVTSPNNKLEVDGHFAFTKNGTSGNRYILIEGADATYAGTMNIQAGFGSTAAGGGIKLYAQAHATYPGSVWIGRGASSAGDIMFGNGGTGPTSASQIQMVIDSSGKVGIGTNSPTELLEVFSETASTAIEVSAGKASTTTGEAKIVLRSLHSSSGTSYSRSEIASVGVAGGDSDLVFRTTSDSSGPQDRMTIDDTGSVIVPGTLHSPGHVIQTVYATNSTLVVPSQTINDYTTFIQVNITPKYATSKILITGIAGVEVGGGNYPTVHCRLYRDSTHIKSYLYWGYEGAQTTHRILNEPIHYLDSPTTTSALTYYAKLANSSGSSYTGTYQGKAHAYNPSTIIVQEIAQ